MRGIIAKSDYIKACITFELKYILSRANKKGYDQFYSTLAEYCCVMDIRVSSLTSEVISHFSRAAANRYFHYPLICLLFFLTIWLFGLYKIEKNANHKFRVQIDYESKTKIFSLLS